MKVITYLESCNMFFAPVDEIIEALVNMEGISGITYQELVEFVNENATLRFYVDNFDTHVKFYREQAIS